MPSTPQASFSHTQTSYSSSARAAAKWSRAASAALTPMASPGQAWPWKATAAFHAFVSISFLLKKRSRRPLPRRHGGEGAAAFLNCTVLWDAPKGRLVGAAAAGLGPAFVLL